jgi:uncharacterized membrane protein
MSGFVSADTFIDNTDTNFNAGTLHLTNITGSGAEANVTLNFTTINAFKVYNTSGNFTSRIFDSGQSAVIFDKIAWTRVLTNSSDVLGYVIDSGVNDIGVFYRNGSIGTNLNQQNLSSNISFTDGLIAYTLPAGFSRDDLIGFAWDDEGSTDALFAFFRNGTVLNATQSALTSDVSFAKTSTYSIPSGFNESDIIGFAVASAPNPGTSAVFFKNGSYVRADSELPPFTYSTVLNFSLPQNFDANDAIGVAYDRTADEIAMFFKNGSIVNATQADFTTNIEFDSVLAAAYDSSFELTTHTNITLQTRVSNDSITFTSWSQNYTNQDGSESIEANVARYIQYKAVLETPDKYITPFLENVSINYSHDLIKPNITSPTTSANSRNFVSPSFVFNASANATDAHLFNVTCTLSGTTVGFFHADGDIHYCNLTAPSTEGIFQINITAIDIDGNTNSTTINFTTKHTTSISLSQTDITVLELNRSDKIVQVNATLTNANTGSSPMYDTGIILDSFPQGFASATTVSYQSCSSNINSSQSCNVTFNITIKGGLAADTYTIFWNANWTNNNFSNISIVGQDLSLPTSTVTVNSNPQITTTENLSITINHGESNNVSVSINSTGNADLQNVITTFIGNTLDESYVTFTPSTFTSISAATNKTSNATITIPKYTSPGNYTGTIYVNASNAENKTILLTVEVLEDSSWTTSPTNVTLYKRTDNAGLTASISLNNSGNIGQKYSIASSGAFKSYVWNDNLNPTSIYVERNTTGSIDIYHTANGPLTSYDLTLTITSLNTSATNITYINLTRDDNNPNVNITNPINNSFVKGDVEFNVTASDLNLSTIKFYVNNNLVFNDVNLTKTFNWSTTSGSYQDAVYTLKAIAYDGAGNFNLSNINVTVNNTDDDPLFSIIPNITLIEDNDSTILNLSLYFRTLDGETFDGNDFKYNFTQPDNITVHVTNSTQIANFTPAANFSGLNYIIFTAIDSSSNTTSSNNITLNVTNVNDAPTTPNLVSPVDGSNVTSSTGRVILSWNASIEADNDPVTYYVFLSNDSSNIAFNATRTATNLQITNLDANETYYWKVLASDNSLNSSNSSTFNFTMIRDRKPIIDFWNWSTMLTNSTTDLSPSVAENKTLSFKINASDPDDDAINFTWYLDNVNISYVQNLTFNLTDNFTAAGSYTLKLQVQDNNSNSAEQEWSVTVTNTNREPLLDPITDKALDEDSLLEFNITALDRDEDGLTFTSNISSISFTNAANNSLATVSWTPTNDYVGSNIVTFTSNDSSKNDSKTITITVTNTNDAPTITSFSPLENKTIAADVGVQRFDITFTDDDVGDYANATWFGNTTGSIVSKIASNSSNVTVTGLSKGIYNITVKVNDTSGVGNKYEWKLTVTTDIVSDELTSPILSLDEAYRQNATNVTINQSTYGDIDFGNETLNFSGIVSLEDAFNISQGFISVDTQTYPKLNKNASIVMKGLSYTKAPLINLSSGFESTADGVLCPEDVCTGITYDVENGILRFNVTHFSTYSTETNTTNGAPVITSTPITAAAESVSYTYDVDATDPDGNTLIFSFITNPSGMSISSTSGVISWTPTSSQIGSHSVMVNVSDDSLEVNQSFQINVGQGPKLIISDLDVKVDKKTDKNMNNNTKIGKDAAPGSTVEFKLEIENLFTDDEDLEIEDIDVEIVIEDIDDGDDLDEDADEFDIKQGKNKDISIEFDIPLEIDEGVYDVIIDVEGEDENGTTHTIRWELDLEVEKESHEIMIIRASLTPSTIKCQRQIAINTEIINTGTDDEDDVTLEITSADLGINSLTTNIELDEGTDDNRLTKQITESISADVGPGTYPIIVSTYYDGKLSESKTADLTVEECELTKKVKKEVKEEKPKVEVIRPTVVLEKKPAAPVESFTATDGYKTLLAILIVLFIGTAIFVVGAGYMVLKKK